MKREFYNQHSEVLGENMSMLVYGEGGYPVIAFQAQDAKSNNFEDFGMIDVLAPFIEDGRIQVFSVDNLDEESWSDEGGDPAARAARQEDYFRFVTDELVPRVRAWNNSDLRPIAVGCSMGATHAAIAALRRPDLFQGCIALSGVYRTGFFFGDWMDHNLYQNDVPAFLSNMSADHPYVDLYNQRDLIFCVGQGAWEMGVDDLHFIDDQLNRLGVNHWCDFWGYDVNHDWPWWRKQMPYFMDEVLRSIAARQQEAAVRQEAPAEPIKKAPVKKAPVKRATTTTRKAPVKKAAAVTAERVTAEPVTAEPVEAPVEEKTATAAKKAPAKRTTTRKAATTKTTAAKTTTKKVAAAEPVAETKAEETVAAEPAVETKAPAAKKAPAKRTTTRKAAATKTTAAKKTTTRKTTTKKADTTENAE